MASGGTGEVSPESSHFARAQHCQPCGSDGNTGTAVGYCRDCRELLCQGCYDGHRTPPDRAVHVLVDIAEINSDQQRDGDSSTCAQHPERPVDYHCPSHGFLGCHSCYYKNHRTCPGVKYIPLVASHVTNIEDFNYFKRRLTNISTQCQDLFAKVAECSQSAENSYTEAVAAFQAHKRKILDALGRLEDQFIQSAGELKQRVLDRMATLSGKLGNLLSDSRRLASTMERLLDQRRYTDLYTTMAGSQDKLLDMVRGTSEVLRSSCKQTVSFRANKEVLKTLRRTFGLGKLQVHGLRLARTLKHVGEVRVRGSSDTATCRITCAALVADSRLVMTDLYNRKLKLLDSKQNRCISELTFKDTKPLYVCKVNENQVAVTQLRTKLALVRLEPALSVEREISVSGHSCGVGYCDGKLVVSFYQPHKVEIMDMEGKVLTTIERDQAGQDLFNDPYNLCIDRVSKLVYVCNYTSDEVLCLRLDGAIVGRYRDSQLARPWQVTVDSGGTVYVCGRNSHNVHQGAWDSYNVHQGAWDSYNVHQGAWGSYNGHQRAWDSYNAHQRAWDGEKVRLLLTQSDGLSHPEAICFNEREDRVYIGTYASDTMQVYQVIYERT